MHWPITAQTVGWSCSSYCMVLLLCFTSFATFCLSVCCLLPEELFLSPFLHSLGRSVIPFIESWRMFVKRVRPRQHTCMTLCVYVQCIVGRCCCVLDRRGCTDVFLDIHQTDPHRLFWISLFLLLTV